MLAQAAGPPGVEARALLRLGSLGYVPGGMPGARSAYERALALYRQAGDRWGEQNALGHLAGIILDSGDYAGAWSALEQALLLTRETGYRQLESYTLALFGDIHHMLGDYPRAQGYYEQALSIAREIADPAGEATFLGGFGASARRQGDCAAAQECEERALRLAHELGAQEIERWVLCFLGDIHADLGNAVMARESFLQALRLFEPEEPNAEDVLCLARAGLAGLALAQGDLAEAQSHAAEILPHLGDDGSSLTGLALFPACLTCYRVLRAAGDPRAAQVLDTAYHLLQEHAARAPNEVLRRSFLQNVAENREIVAEFERSRRAQ